jgi:peptidyl-tRNA hydrolase, PTH1 family
VKVIVGLGNPGKKYDRTRHNAGFLVIDSLLAHQGCSLTDRQNLFRSGRTEISGEEVLLSKPDLFMNESGRAVQSLTTMFELVPASILVVVDDINLPIGKIRFRSRGSSGGHNGLASIIAALGTEDFPRLRLGIGRPGEETEILSDYVLDAFTKEELKELRPQIERARDACLEWATSGNDEQVMQGFN